MGHTGLYVYLYTYLHTNVFTYTFTYTNTRTHKYTQTIVRGRMMSGSLFRNNMAGGLANTYKHELYITHNKPWQGRLA